MTKNGNDELPKRDREAGRKAIEAQRRREERTGFGDKELGTGGARTTTDGRPVGEGSLDGWQTGGR